MVKMANMLSLKRSISQMSDAEIDELIQSRRQARREYIERNRSRRSSKKRTKTKKSKDHKNDLISMFGNLSEEEKQKLLNDLK